MPPDAAPTHLVDPSKELRLMLAFFGEARLPHSEVIPAEAVPEPFHRLLVHDNHMTVTLEEYHGAKVVVRPYRVHRQGDMYGRKLDLYTETPASQVVMTGIMLINLGFVTPAVQTAIVAQSAPLGRILIEHNILRQVSSGSYLRLDPADPLAARFSLHKPQPVYGRIATIFCDEKPAIDLLEIVNPEA